MEIKFRGHHLNVGVVNVEVPRCPEICEFVEPE